MGTTASHATTPLLHRGRTPASVFVWVPGSAEASLTIETDGDIGPVEVKGPAGELVRHGRPEALPRGVIGGVGIWEIAFGAVDSDTGLRLVVEGDGYPFIMPGPGIVPSHFPNPGPPLLLAAADAFSLWADIPEPASGVTVQASLPPSPAVVCTPPGGAGVEVAWYTWRTCAYRTALLSTADRYGWWQFAGSAEAPFRFTVQGGLPLFFERPSARFPYAWLLPKVTDEEGAPLEARVEVWRGCTQLALAFAHGVEGRPIPVAPGPMTARASRGIEYAPQTLLVELHPYERRETPVSLRRVLPRLEGWVSGDLHLHTCANSDGGDLPARVVEAGRAQGLGFVFLSDAPEAMREAGLELPHAEEAFLALPGEELATPDVHANALNMPSSLAHLTDEKDTPASVARWLNAIEGASALERPATLMLNHPSHLPASMAAHGYFRSWWLADRFAEIKITENFDFESWFHRLNQGHRLTGLWTTDSHDSSLLPAGAKRNYVWVGPHLTEQALLEGLIGGRCFSTRDPGAVLLLRVNGVGIGETAVPEKGSVRVAVRCEATRPLTRVELIADGETLRRWRGGGSLAFEAAVSLPASMRWLLARAFVEEEGWPPADGHTMEPIMLSRCIAFTNPVWIEAARPKCTTDP